METAEFMDLDFHSITLADLPAVDRAVRAAGVRGGHYSFYNLYCLRNKYHTQICFCGETFVIRQHGRDRGNRACYFFPPGLSERPADTIRSFVRAVQEKGPSFFWGLDEKMKEALDAACPGAFDIQSDRDWADYLYDTRTIAEPRIGHPAKYETEVFCRRHTYECLPVVPELIPELLEFQSYWMERYAGDTGDRVYLEQEDSSIREALSLWTELNLMGTCCRIDGRLCGFVYGREHTEEDFILHVLKSDNDYRNLSVFQFNSLAARLPNAYINMEEDIGLSGLRLFKTRLMPIALWSKYTAIPL